MPVNLAQYRVTVGIFNNCQIFISLHYEASFYSGMSNNLFNYGCGYSSLIFLFFFYTLFLSKKSNVLKITAKFCVPFFLFHNIGARIRVCLHSLLLMLSSDVELNPGPLSNCKGYFSICHWNLNNISAHDYSKLFPMKAYIVLHKFDIICLSETYLDFTTPNDDDKLQILGYTLIRSDHPSNTKGGVVYIYYNIPLPLRVINTGCLHECLNFERQIGAKICNFVALCRSASQSQGDFETFADNFEMTLELLAQKSFPVSSYW